MKKKENTFEKWYIRCRDLCDNHQSFSSYLIKRYDNILEMEVLKKLEELVPNKPYLGFAKLSPGYHKILCFRSVKNKYGKKGDGSKNSILIELDDQVLFLPQYFNQKITGEDDIRRLNTAIEKNETIYVYFGGRDEKTK